LLDTNIWLERLLDQERADEVGRFLEIIPSDQLYITDFAFHSIAVIMIRLEAGDGLVHFVEDLFERGLCKTRDFGQSQSLSDFKTATYM